MNYMKTIIFLLYALLLTASPVNGTAAAQTGQQVSFDSLNKTVIDDDKARNIWENMEFMPLKLNGPVSRPIVSFAVNADGRIAVAYDWFVRSSDNYIVICVYDSSFNRLSAYRTQPYGMYGIEWIGDNLLYVEQRGNIAAEFTVECELVRMYGIRDEEYADSQAFRLYMDRVLHSGTHSAGGSVCKLEYTNEWLFTTEQRLVRYSGEGAEPELLYLYGYGSAGDRLRDNALPVVYVGLIAFNMILLAVIRLVKRIRRGLRPDPEEAGIQAYYKPPDYK